MLAGGREREREGGILAFGRERKLLDSMRLP
jgi:hypothetical protein